MDRDLLPWILGAATDRTGAIAAAVEFGGNSPGLLRPAAAPAAAPAPSARGAPLVAAPVAGSGLGLGLGLGLAEVQCP